MKCFEYDVSQGFLRSCNNCKCMCASCVRSCAVAVLSLLLQLMVLICGGALGTAFKLFCMCAAVASSMTSQPMVANCIVQSAWVLSN